MISIRVHGRGGQGVVTAAEIIAIAAFNEGKFAQALPYFGTERTGAPVQAFARLADQPIKNKEHIYEPDILIIQDPTLLKVKEIFIGTGPKTIFIVNAPKKITKKNYYTVDATKTALEILGKNIIKENGDSAVGYEIDHFVYYGKSGGKHILETYRAYRDLKTGQNVRLPGRRAMRLEFLVSP